MYALLLKAHVGLAVLALLLTLGWAAFIVAASAGAGRWSRLTYIGAMASTGVVGVTGVIAAFAGGFAAMAFPWIGLVAVAGHGFAGMRSRRYLAADRERSALGAAALQVALLVVAYGVMTAKHF
jgi:succinate dehydrogenase hydrophobic anchor subunit